MILPSPDPNLKINSFILSIEVSSWVYKLVEAVPPTTRHEMAHRIAREAGGCFNWAALAAL